METARGLAVSTNSSDVIDALNHFHEQILGSKPDAQLILQAAATHANNVLLNVYSAAFYLYAQEDAATLIATDYLHQAEKLLSKTNLREKLLFQATKAWQRLDYECALTLLTSVTELYPRDTLAAKFAEWILYCTGQKYQAKRYLSLCDQMAAVNQDESHFLAMHAFAHELNGHLSDSKRMAEKAVSLDPLTPWAHHCLSHVYLNNNDIEGGLRAMQSFQASWENIQPLLRGHNTWHIALFHLAQRDLAAVMKLYPVIFGTLPDLVCEQLDTISLLWRMDLAGLSQDDLFAPVVSHVANKPFEQYTGFNTLHYLYCLAKAGEWQAVSQALSVLQNYIYSLSPGFNQELWQKIILPASKAVVAFVQQDYQQAYLLLKPVIADCFLVGGSDAQDELFTQTYLLCLIRLNKMTEAQQFFTDYLGHYKNTALAAYWFDSKGSS